MAPTSIFPTAFGLNNFPNTLGYTFPAEFHPHVGTWLSWPHKKASWPGKIDSIYPIYAQFIKAVAEGELVNINIAEEQMRYFVINQLQQVGCSLKNIRFHYIPTNDAWCRDHGPAFLINPKAVDYKKVIVDWGYNAWGDKYPPYDLDDVVPTHVGNEYGIPVYNPGIVMEGGSVEFNGKGTVLTTTSCLLNKNRNPHLNQIQIEAHLMNFYGVTNVLWLGDGIVGDDTDGHIDDITRFVNEDTVVTVIEDNASDENYLPLKENAEALSRMKLEDGRSMNVIELPMPHAVEYDGMRLPASYANFYISNAAVVVPVFRDRINDDKALSIIENCFPTRKVIGLDSTDIIWGLGSFHCLSQQEPFV